MLVQPPGSSNSPNLPVSNPIDNASSLMPPSKDPNEIRDNILNFIIKVQDYYVYHVGNLGPTERQHAETFCDRIKDQLVKIGELNPQIMGHVKSVCGIISSQEQGGHNTILGQIDDNGYCDASLFTRYCQDFYLIVANLEKY